MNRVIFFSGLPKAGKSVTLHGLHQYLVAAGRGREFFLERVHPDQEGNWTAETPSGSELARELKNHLKAAGTWWSEEFVQRACTSIAGLAKAFPVVLADMGGIPSIQNRQILAAARAAGAQVEAVILYPVGTDPQEWVDFWAMEGVEPTILATQFGVEEFEAEKSRVAKAALCLCGLGPEDPAHGPDHIAAVRREARKLAEIYAPDLMDVVDEAARLHDVGLAVDRETHHLVVAEVVANEPHLQAKWGDRLPIVVEAVREHRASVGNPTHVVGKIVSDADRLGTPEGSNPLRRSMEYQLAKGKASSTEEALRQAAEHIREKYGPGGTGTRAYFPETAAAITAARQPILEAEAAGDVARLAELAGVELPRRAESPSIDAGMPGNEDGAWGSSSYDGWRVD